MKLSDVTLRRVKATDKLQKCAAGGGLYLYAPTVASSGGWTRFEGKRKDLSFEAYSAVGLKDARADSRQKSRFRWEEPENARKSRQKSCRSHPSLSLIV